MLVTALNRSIGYDNAAKIAKLALKNGTTLKHEAIKSRLISEKEYEKHNISFHCQTLVNELKKRATKLKNL